jgi:hypothetical protein
MNGNPRLLTSPGERSDASTVIGAACAQIVLPGKGNTPTMPSSRRASGQSRLSNFSQLLCPLAGHEMPVDAVVQSVCRHST